MTFSCFPGPFYLAQRVVCTSAKQALAGDAFSRNGTELTRNIPQDAKTRNGQFFNSTINRYTHKPAIHTQISLQ